MRWRSSPNVIRCFTSRSVDAAICRMRLTGRHVNSGLPIVASDVGEVGAVLARGDAGLLVEPGNAHALAREIDALLLDGQRARELGERAARRATAEYDVSQMVRRYRDVY